jgi:hypothetical protein
MGNQVVAEAIQRWFHKYHGGSLLLPDGWYGRPYDNIHTLSEIHSSKNELRLILDDCMIITFEGEPDIRQLNDGIELYGFIKATVEDKDDDKTWVIGVYDIGAIKFVLHPGRDDIHDFDAKGIYRHPESPDGRDCKIRKLLFEGYCSRCNHRFDFICDDGPPGGGRVLLSTKSMQPAVIYYCDDPVFEEVASIVDDLLKDRGMSQLEVAKKFDQIFGEICDMAPDSSKYSMSCNPYCPLCGSRLTSWGPSDPPRSCKVEIPRVTHIKWDTLEPQQKREWIQILLRIV